MICCLLKRWRARSSSFNRPGRPGLVSYEAATRKVLETVDFVPNSCDPHGLAMHDDKLISRDAGIHLVWPNNDSPTAGWIFQIDFL